MAKVKVQLPPNVTYGPVHGHVWREGESFEIERDELVEAHIRNGNLIEVKPAKKK